MMGKKYGNPKEEKSRFQVFVDNMNKVFLHNRNGNKGYIQGVTMLSDFVRNIDEVYVIDFCL